MVQSIIARHDDNINTSVSTKPVSSFQTIHALSNKLYNVSDLKFGGYNKRTQQRYEAQHPPNISIIGCTTETIWI